MNVLITSASRKVGLVRAFQRVVAQTGGGRVLAADISLLSAALHVADEPLIVPRSDDPQFVPALAELCDRHEIGLIVPTRDEELPVFAAALAAFDRRGVRVSVSPPDVIQTCQDKLAFAGFCARNGLATPPVYPDPVHASLPAFVKPRWGKGASGTAVVRTRAELKVALGRLNGRGIVQEYVEAPEYTIDLFADFSSAVVSIIPRRRVQVVAGESYVSTVELRPELIAIARRLASKLDFVGHVTIQCFLTDRGASLIEVNPRFGGAAALGWAAGADTPLFLVQLAKGQHPDPPGKLRDRLTMLRFTDDLFLSPDELARVVS